MARQLVGHQLCTLVDVQIARAESKRRNRDLGDLPGKDSFERASQRASHAIARDALRRARDHGMDEQLHRQLTGPGHHRRTDRERLGERELVAAASNRRSRGVVASSVAVAGRTMASPA